MNRRLRKKKHRGEFQRLGFDFTGRLHESADVNTAADRLISILETNRMAAGGMFDQVSGCIFFVIGGVDRSCTEEDRTAVNTWAGMLPWLFIKVGELEDAWHDAPIYAGKRRPKRLRKQPK